MPARLNRMHTESVIQKIKASQLLNFLQDHAVDGKYSKVAKTRIDAAKFLLERVLARAEAPKQLNVSLSLAELIKQSLE
jgi:hypothetical protein